MSRMIQCSCCHLPVKVSSKHVGKAVLCPRTGKRLLIGRVLKPLPAWAFLCLLGGVVAGGVWLAWPKPLEKYALPEPQFKSLSNRALVMAPSPAPVPEPVVIEATPFVPPPATEVAPLPRRELVAVEPEPPKEPRYLTKYELPKRLDAMSTADLEAQLLAVKEVDLDLNRSKVNQKMLNAMKAKESIRTPYLGALALGRSRPEIAGLPFKMGSDARLDPDQAKTMETLSKALRSKMSNVGKEEGEPRLDALYATLEGPQWAGADSVNCIAQMLQPETTPIRRLSCELLRDIDTPASTAALVQWAVFDTDAGNRAAAVDALKARDRVKVGTMLAKHLRHPWPAAVEHACESLVALGCEEMLAAVLAAKELPDPDAPYEVNLPHATGGLFRQQMVRVNHARNCVMCHAPSTGNKEVLQATVPSESQPLPLSNTPQYYNGGGELIAASTTYLKQDFSVMQPVENHGPWPVMQRYDYFVAVKRELSQTPARPKWDSRFQKAYDFALVGLGGAVPDVIPSKAETRLAETAKFVSLQLHPDALNALKTGWPLIDQKPVDLQATIIQLQHQHGLKANRVALVAYLADLVETGNEVQNEKATKMLAVVRGSTADMDLAARLARAVK